MITETIQKSFRTITINKGQYKFKKSEKAKNLKQIKKLARKSFESATAEEKAQKLQDYIDAQKELRQELQNEEKSRVEQRMKMITEQGGAGSDHFWRIRKKILSQGKNESYDLISEEGDHIF